jgi:hypothetical protein
MLLCGQRSPNHASQQPRIRTMLDQHDWYLPCFPLEVEAIGGVMEEEPGGAKSGSKASENMLSSLV